MWSYSEDWFFAIRFNSYIMQFTLMSHWIVFYVSSLLNGLSRCPHCLLCQGINRGVLIPKICRAEEIAETLSNDMQKESLLGRTLTLKLKTTSFEVSYFFSILQSLVLFPVLLCLTWILQFFLVLSLFMVNLYFCYWHCTKMHNFYFQFISVFFFHQDAYSLSFLFYTNAWSSQVKTRATSLQKYIQSKEDIFSHATKLLKAELPLSVRLIGITVFL